MEITNKKNHLSCIKASFIMLLFSMCLIMNVLFCCSSNVYELLDKTTVVDTGAIAENAVVSGDDDNTTTFKAPFLSKNNSYHETITKNICTIPMTAAIPDGISLHLFIVILFFFITLFILLPDGWTLIVVDLIN